MMLENDFDLSSVTSFGTGGKADQLLKISKTIDLLDYLQQAKAKKPDWVLGYGTNSLVSDYGLKGLTCLLQGGEISIDDSTGAVVGDAGVWWDDLVKYAIRNNLWGIELMSGIPGSVGAATVGNIGAYGQSVSDSLLWVEGIDLSKKPWRIARFTKEEAGLGYRISVFQTPKCRNTLIVRAAFALAKNKTQDLEYESALNVSRELEADVDTLAGRRMTIIESRQRAGSLVETQQSHKSAGSFFKNPLVSVEKVNQIIEYEEHGVTKQRILQQQKVHGGSPSRVSAALVLLAAGFKRGQSWGPVRLHPEHVLKIENANGATSQQIYDVAQRIITQVKKKLDIDLEPEVQFLGRFN